MAKIISSPLKWCGGKKWLIDRMKNYYSQFEKNRYVDLFAGSCILPINLQPQKVWINDYSPDVYGFWKWVQNIKSAPSLPGNDPATYKQVRDKYNATRSPELFFYLNRHCHGGVCRVNSSGNFNVPTGNYAKPLIPDLLPYRKIIEKWKITSFDFGDVPLSQNDFVFADPPYDGGFVEYTAQKFTWDDQLGLAKYLASAPCPVVATNAATDRIIDLYMAYGFNIEIVQAPRSISRSGDRAPVNEMIATKQVINCLR